MSSPSRARQRGRTGHVQPLQSQTEGQDRIAIRSGISRWRCKADNWARLFVCVCVCVCHSSISNPQLETQGCQQGRVCVCVYASLIHRQGWITGSHTPGEDCSSLHCQCWVQRQVSMEKHTHTHTQSVYSFKVMFHSSLQVTTRVNTMTN